MGAFGRNRTKSSKSTYRVTGMRKRNTGTKKKFSERGYGFAYGYARTKPKTEVKKVKGRNHLYKIGVGIEGFVLENHFVEAKNAQEARSIAIGKYLHPDKGYDHLQVSRYKK